MTENLDLKCAEAGRKIASESGADDRLLNRALGVLEEQGVYAFFLFLNAQGKEPGKKISEACLQFLQTTPNGSALLPDEEQWQALQKLGQNLDSLLFARELLRQVLVYAEYHVKVKGEVRE